MFAIFLHFKIGSTTDYLKSKTKNPEILERVRKREESWVPERKRRRCLKSILRERVRLCVWKNGAPKMSTRLSLVRCRQMMSTRPTGKVEQKREEERMMMEFCRAK